jgi:uncharacterized protein (TIGR00251 family)
MLRETPSGVELTVRVIPRARKTGIAGTRGDALLVRLAAPAVEGAANKALVEFLATLLKLPRRSIQLVAGDHARQKRLLISNLSVEAVRSRLA